MDPAVGSGELLISLLERLEVVVTNPIRVYGFETDPSALFMAKTRLEKRFRNISVQFHLRSFLDFVEDDFGIDQNYNLFRDNTQTGFDLIIANPPYVRTQIMGAPNQDSSRGDLDLRGE
jgi:methylase of polypeptide subunit release factors